MSQNRSKTIAKNTLILYIRMLFLMIISLYTGRVILKALGVDDYGIYNVVGGFVAMFALVSASLTSANTRFLNYEMGKGNKEKLNTVFSSCVTIQYTLAIIIAILCESIGLWYVNNVMVLPPDRLTAANWCFQFSIFNFCMNLVTVPYNAAIIAHEKMKTFAYVSIFEGIAKLAISFLILWNPIDRLVYYALLLLIMQFIIRYIYQYYCRKHFEECLYHFVIDKHLLKQIFAYSGWHIIGNSAGILKVQGVNVILNLFFGTVVNASKGIANQVLHAVQGFASNFMLAINPQITQSYAKGEISYMINLVHKGSKFSYYMLFLISLPIIINADYLLHVWLEEVPNYAVMFSQLTLIVTIITSLSNPLITAQNATGNVRNYQIIVGGIQLCNLPLCYLTLWMGYSPVSVMVVAIIVELASLLARLIMIPIYIPEFNPTNYFTDVLLRCIEISILSAIVPILLLNILPQSFLSLLLSTAACLTITAVVTLYLGCNKNERQFIYSKISSAKNKFIKK